MSDQENGRRRHRFVRRDFVGVSGALMVPTEILAEQHADSLVSLFANEDVNIALLTSSVKGKRRRELWSGLLSERLIF